MAKHVAHTLGSNGKFYTCQPDKGLEYGQCVFCGQHVARNADRFCNYIQYWDNEYDEYVLRYDK